MESTRKIILDTETTGFSAEDDRIVEIGCIEVDGFASTGRTFHVYINPEREVQAEAARVHGLTTERLAREKPFRAIMDSFLEFIGDAMLVAHNASFDMGFINAELLRNGRPAIALDRAIDTLIMAREKLPSLSRHNLDSLCNYYGIDNSNRDLHGALLDARLLTEVYIELLGGREVDFLKVMSGEVEDMGAGIAGAAAPVIEREFRAAREFAVPAEELAAHRAFVEKVGDKAVWNKI
ncbi:MAG: DNA polymerase III subunit epsilon [Alphaproteobacteria bacterium]|nr:DNA polymerase III subunit epsilon [Alphaproteobacteria bacterium]